MARREHLSEQPSEETASDRQVACSLASADMTAQVSRWQRLAVRSMTERTETADGLRICFRPDPGVEGELRELAAAETDCCPWAAWTVNAVGHTVVLEVRSQGEGVTTLHGMFAGLSPARPGHHG